MTESKVMGLVRQPGWLSNKSIIIFPGRGSAQGLKLPCFVQKNDFFAGWIYELKLTLCTCPQEESKYDYRPPGISQKPPETSENNRGCFYGSKKGGARGEE
jgi:hypothetical protein